MGTVLRVDQNEPSFEVRTRAAKVLRDEGVLVMPTDSVYGIGCMATEGNSAHERIFQIKRRDRAQTLPLLIGSPSDLTVLGRKVPKWARLLADELWPGALTLVVPASNVIPSEYVAQNGTIALRVPDSSLVRALAKEVGPLATTSANIHGAAAAISGASVEPGIVEQADLTLDAGSAPVAVASTIVGSSGGRLRILREGAIPEERIRRLLA